MTISKREAAENLFKLDRDPSLNIFQNKTVFRVEVLTPPKAFSGPATARTPSGVAGTSTEAVALIRSDESDPNKISKYATASKYVFMGRIINPNMAHEKFLEEPCRMATANKPEETATMVALHARIILATDEKKLPFQEGDVIFAECDPGDNNMLYDLQHMHFVKIDNLFKKQPSLEPCEEKLANLFSVEWANVGDYADPEIGNYIGTKGKQEVENGLVPAGLIGTTSTGAQLLFDVVAEFNKLAEAFKKETGVSLSGGGYRSYDSQVKVYDDPSKWRLKPALKEKCTNPGVGDCVHLAATPGTSNHGWGMAFDWNTKDKDGKIEFESKTYDWMLKNASKYGWTVPSWAQKGGSKPEAWHIEYANKKNLITDVRDAPTDTDEADAAS